MRIFFIVSLVSLYACGRIYFEKHSASITDGSTSNGPSCADHIQNQNEEGIDCGGVCLPCTDITSCADLKQKQPATTNGVYEVDIDGASGPLSPFQVYCEMVADGGGWTLAAKMNGANDTFRYSSTLWTDLSVLNPTQTALDSNEAKFESFNSMPFTNIRVGMQVGANTNWLVIPLSQSSLRDFFASDAPLATSLGTAQWSSLLVDTVLQSNCTREGFNIGVGVPVGSYNQIRIGLFGDNEVDCNTPDSYIGFGVREGIVDACAFTATTFVGNAAACAGNDRDTQALGFIMVR